MTLKDFVDAVSTLGTLGFALLAVYAFLTKKIVPWGWVQQIIDLLNEKINELRIDKKEALDLAREAIASNKRLADAWEASNRLETARVEAERESRRRR